MRYLKHIIILIGLLLMAVAVNAQEATEEANPEVTREPLAMTDYELGSQPFGCYDEPYLVGRVQFGGYLFGTSNQEFDGDICVFAETQQEVVWLMQEFGLNLSSEWSLNYADHGQGSDYMYIVPEDATVEPTIETVEQMVDATIGIAYIEMRDNTNSASEDIIVSVHITDVEGHIFFLLFAAEYDGVEGSIGYYPEFQPDLALVAEVQEAYGVDISADVRQVTDHFWSLRNEEPAFAVMGFEHNQLDYNVVLLASEGIIFWYDVIPNHRGAVSVFRAYDFFYVSTIDNEYNADYYVAIQIPDFSVEN